MLEQINEPIQVIADFLNHKLVPIKFVWNNREVLIKKTNLAWSTRSGRGKFYYFAVSDGINYFKLQFSAENLDWTLLEVYSD